MGQVIQIDEARIKDQLCGASRYERNEGRRDTRYGGVHYRSLPK